MFCAYENTTYWKNNHSMHRQTHVAKFTDYL